MLILSWLPLAIVVFGCRGGQTTAGGDSAVPSASAAPSVTASTSATTKRAMSPADTRAHDIEALVRAWNEGINAHDTTRLASLYADAVELYGTRMSRAQALHAKQASFAKHDHDSLSSISVSAAGHAQFDKKSTGRDGKVIHVTGYLDTRQIAGKWLITSEGDTTTDTNLERAKQDRCQAAVLALVDTTPEAERARRAIQEPEFGVVPTGATSVATPPDHGGPWLVQICEVHPDRLMCGPDFEVDPDRAVVFFTGVGAVDGGSLRTDPKAAARVRDACK